MRGMKRGLAAAGLGIFLLAAAGCGLGRRVLESQLGGQSAQEKEDFLAEESAGTEAGSWLERLWRSLWPQADDEGEDEDRAGANGWGADGVAATEEELEVALRHFQDRGRRLRWDDRHLSCSIGALALSRPRPPEELYLAADRLLYAAKARGRDQYVIGRDEAAAPIPAGSAETAGP